MKHKVRKNINKKGNKNMSISSKLNDSGSRVEKGINKYRSVARMRRRTRN